MRGCHDVGTWKNEMRVCSQLRKKYGDEFLLWVQPIEGYKFNSLVFYLSVLGKNYLSDQLVEYNKVKDGGIIKQPKAVPLTETKLEQDASIKHQPRTLKEFLQYGKEIGSTSSNTIPH